jgi:plasmid stabilization system protein ParE
MMNFIQWTGPAFRELEHLPEKLAFDIIRRIDLLSNFPELGPDLASRFHNLAGLRQLIIDRRWRVIYEFDETQTTVWILAVQTCRQRLPSQRKLKRHKNREDDR